LDALAEIAKESRYLLYDETDWKLCKTSKTVKVYKCRAPNNRPHCTFKSEFPVKCSPEKMLDMVHPNFHYYKRYWDPFVAGCIVIEELSHNVVLQHNRMKKAAKGLIAARDSIDIVQFIDRDDMKGVEFGSVKHPNYPPIEHYIRSWAHPSAAYIFPTDDPNHCIMKLLFQVDINTKYMPQSVFEAATPTMLCQVSKALQNTEKIKWTPLGDVEGRRNPETFVLAQSALVLNKTVDTFITESDQRVNDDDYEDVNDDDDEFQDAYSDIVEDAEEATEATM